MRQRRRAGQPRLYAVVPPHPCMTASGQAGNISGMKWICISLLAVAFGTTSCVVYLDNPPRCTVQGRVLQANGRPVSNAVVRVTGHRRHMAVFTEQPVNVAASAVTDSNGAFVVTGKMAFPVTLSAVAPPLSARVVMDQAPTNAVILPAKSGRGLNWR